MLMIGCSPPQSRPCCNLPRSERGASCEVALGTEGVWSGESMASKSGSRVQGKVFKQFGES